MPSLDQMMQIAAAPPAPQLSVASPFNDTQLIALIAAGNQTDTVAEAVSRAMDTVAEAIVQIGPGQQNLARLIQAKVQRKKLQD